MTQRNIAEFWFCLVVGFGLPSQAPHLVEIPQNIRRGCGLQVESDGTVIGLGTDYQVTFASGRFVFLPCLGRIAPRDFPITMELTHVGRIELSPVAAAETVLGKLRVEFVRPGLTERLDLRPEGLKQSFVFAALPPGNGDLVVRARYMSELLPEQASSDGALRFTFPGAGGVEFGQVVGIDANGERATGAMRCHGDCLEFVLPAAFVDKAALPLVVDPLIGATVIANAGGNGPAEDESPLVAHLGLPYNRYLVVWHNRSSSINSNIRTQQVSDTGTLVGSQSGPASGLVNPVTPCVTTIDSGFCWPLMWELAGDISGRITAPATLSNVFTVAGGLNNQVEPDIAGGLFGSPLGVLPRAVVVWRDTTANAIKCRTMDAPLGGNIPALGPELTLVSGSATVQVSSPKVSHDNPLDRFLLTYESNNSITSVRGVRGLLVSRDGIALGSNFPIAGVGLTRASGPAVAGDGNNWVVGYVTSNVVTGSGSFCVAVRINGLQPIVGAPRALQPLGVTVRKIAIAWFGNSAVLVYSSVVGTQNHVLLTSVDPFTCLDCEGQATVDTTSNNHEDVAIVSRFGHQLPSAEGAVLWTRQPAANLGNVMFQRFLAVDGTETVLPVGCTPGVVSARCAHVGNANFAMQLRGGTSNAPVFVLTATTENNTVCGPCTIVPDLASGVISFLGNTSALGDSTYSIPIPNLSTLAGVNLTSQFAFLSPQCLNIVSLTDAVRATIE